LSRKRQAVSLLFAFKKAALRVPSVKGFSLSNIQAISSRYYFAAKRWFVANKNVRRF
jgi:hypothetical protein